MISDKVLIGKKIRSLRKQSGFTQEQFSEKIGIEPAPLSNIENGKSYPSMQTVLKVFKEFNITPDKFFDCEYYKNDNELENEIIEIIKKQSGDKKQILYRIIKCFDI
ncbi:MAG: helix-turn-helix transcriptional regulator [Brachyspira sp.]|nr:helix-turn-helix transcriptional regulator [Brachyspira sp.]